MATDRSTRFPIPKSELYYWDETAQVLKPLVETDGAMKVKGQMQVGVTSSDIMQPVDIQSHYQQTIQTHAGAMVAPNTINISSVWIDTNGFDEIYPTLKNDTQATSRLDLQWSHDANTLHIEEKLVIPSGTELNRGSTSGVVLKTKARYVKVVIWNSDTTAPHTMQSWIYLKA